MDKLRAGVIGLGMGRGHVSHYQRHPSAEVVAIADRDENKLNSVGEAHNIAARFSNGEDLIEAASKLNLDIISVVTPNKFHKTMTIEALKAGCHVLCEKPMAMNTAEAKEMLAAEEETGRRLMINFSFRFNPVADALKRQVDAGRLGHVYFARSIWLRRKGMPGRGWFGQKTLSGGGPLIDLGVHRIDLALWLMGYPEPEWVMASTYDHLLRKEAATTGQDIDVEDIAVAMVRFDNGATLEAEASWVAHIAEKNLMETRLMGTEGGLLYKNEEGGYGFSAHIFHESEGYHFDSTLNQPEESNSSAMSHFVDCILEDRPHIATAREGVIVMELLDAIYESAGKGEPVKVN